MGGTAAGDAAAHPGALSLNAYVSFHAPALQPRLIKMPTMLTTGGLDLIVFPAAVIEAFEVSVNAHPRVLADLANATHFEPVAPSGALPGGQQRLNAYAAQFYLCYLAGNTEACGLVSDASNPRSLCNAYAAGGMFTPPFGDCIIGP
jgi:hypothetical protein